MDALVSFDPPAPLGINRLGLIDDALEQVLHERGLA